MDQPGILDHLFTTCYSGRSVYMKAGDINFQVAFIKYENGRVMLRIGQDITPGKNILYVRQGDEVVFSHLKFLASREGISVFDVENLQVIKAPRREERKKMESVAGEAQPFMTSILPDFLMAENLARESKIMERVKDELAEKVGAGFPGARIFFIHEKKQDARMRYFLSCQSPMFIPDVNDPSTVSDGELYSLYRDGIYADDAALRSKGMVSEMAVPLLYKGMMPFGYIQVNGLKPFSADDMSALRKTGASLSELLSRDKKLIVPGEDNFTVTDMSLHGLAVIFREKAHIRYFKEGSLIIFSLVMPGRGQASIMATVRNITQADSMAYRVGCSIEKIDPIGEAHFSEYLESLPTG